MQTPLNPMRAARAVEIIKKQKLIARNYQRLFAEAEKASAPLWTENKRLRELVASYERSIRHMYETERHLRDRLEAITDAIVDAVA